MSFKENVPKSSTKADLNSVKVEKEGMDNKPTNDNNDQKYLMPQTICSTELPIPNVVFHSLTSVSSTNFILTGGISGDGRIFNHVFLGNISKDQTDVTWKELKPMRNQRGGHLSFKLNSSLYVAGGVDESLQALSCCEKYDINKDEWKDVEHALPYRLTGSIVSTSKDESFTTIVGGYKGKSVYSKEIITFTEQEGFQVLNDIGLIHNKACGTSITL